MRLLFRRLTPYRVCLIMAGALAVFGLIASPLNELAPGLWRIREFDTSNEKNREKLRRGLIFLSINDGYVLRTFGYCVII